MRDGLIITAVGRDRPGIVDRLSGIIFQEGCNLEDSRMAILGGEFALIVLATGSRESVSRLAAKLERARADLDLGIEVRRTDLDEAETPPEALLYRITAVSIDHPGIVHRISNVLARHGVNVAALDTRITHAPTTGTPVFALTVEAQVPANLSIAELRAALEEIAGEENLDLDVHAVT